MTQNKSNMRAMASLVCLMTCFLGCPSGLGINGQVERVIVDFNDNGACNQACVKLSSLGCVEAQPLKADRQCVEDSDCPDISSCIRGECETSCLDFCIATQDNGVWLNPTCVMNIKTCDELNLCPTL